MTFHQTVIPETNCAGQGCPERDGCRRYEVRLRTEHEPDNGFRWASFDLERRGRCIHRIAMEGARR